jgi:hypothetical protein
MYGHTDTVANFHTRKQLYGVSAYAVFLYVRFWPTLHIPNKLHVMSRLRSDAHLI